MFRQSFAIACVLLGALLLDRAEAASNVVQYSYDAAGNIVGIQRANPAPITLTGLSPASGAPGNTVAITGTGFSATAASNAVSFNGAAAAVVASSPTSLTVTVPANATTGKVAIAVAGNTIVSAQDFVVTVPGAPTIASFTPAKGTAGAIVTVTGTNFSPVAGATTVKLNRNPAATSAVTATTVSFTVPSGTSSGKILITTPGGSVASSADFIVPPAGVAATDILATTRLATDGPAANIALYATNKFGLVLFDGTAGAWMSLQIPNFTITPAGLTIPYTIYKPDNTQLADGALSAWNLSIHLPQLPMDGTYSLVLRTGLAQVSLDAKAETNRFVLTDAAPLEFTRSGGQSTRALIAGVAGEQKALMVSGLATTPVNGVLDVHFALPSRSIFRRANASGLGTTIVLAPLTVTGTHSVYVITPAEMTQSAYKVALLGGAVLQVEGPPANVAIANPGEAARLTFSGVAGENLGLGVSDVALNPTASAGVSVTVYRPDGWFLFSTLCGADGTRCAGNLENLSATGTYSVIMQPASGQTGTQRVWLSRDLGGTLVIDAPLGVALTRPGQNARLTFAGTAGQTLRLSWSGVASVAGTTALRATLPTGSTLASTSVPSGGIATFDIPALPATGNYILFVDPSAPATLNATVRITPR